MNFILTHYTVVFLYYRTIIKLDQLAGVSPGECAIMLRWKKATAVATVLLVIGSMYALWRKDWVPVGLFFIALFDWGVLTCFMRSMKQKAIQLASNMAGANQAIGYLLGTLATLGIINNPDGVLYILANTVVCFIGGKLGTLIAAGIFPDRPE